MKEKTRGTLPVMLFLAAELVLYILILFAGGKVAVISSFVSVALCFAFGLMHLPCASRLLLVGIGLTVAADVCLVLWQPRQQLWGMIFFLCAQSVYAVKLHTLRPGRVLLILRGAFIAVALTICILVLGKNTDALALISLCYYANLIMNLLAAVCAGKKHRLLAIGFALFLLCDTVIGLQEAAKGYLTVGENTLFYQILFMNFNMAWAFYLPSQVCIALCSFKEKKIQ